MAAAVHAPRASAQPAAQPAAPVKSASSHVEIVEDRRRGEDGSAVVRKYSKGKLLGKGGFAKCYQFISLNTGTECAGKVVSKSSLQKERTKQKLLAEIRIHRALQHKHVVRFDSYFEDRNNVYIMLEICKNQTLMEMIRRRKRLSEPEARYLSLQLLDALRYMHSNNVIHRDLKLGNLFLDSSMDIKVGDLGLATLLSHETERKRTICGTPNYIAPEILMNASDGHSFEVDMWSFGVILYTLTVGKPPFETKNVKTTYRRIKTNQYSFPPTAPISEAARDLISQLLAHDPKHRATLTGALQHPWFTDPSAVVPARLPPVALTTLPHFSPSEMCASADVVAAILASTPGGLRVRASSRRSTPVHADGRATDENTFTTMHGKPTGQPAEKRRPQAQRQYQQQACDGARAPKAASRVPLGHVDSNAHGGNRMHSRRRPTSSAYHGSTARAGFSVYSGPENTAAAPAPAAPVVRAVPAAPVVRAVDPPQVPASAPSLGGLTAPPVSSRTPPPRAAVSTSAGAHRAAAPAPAPAASSRGAAQAVAAGGIEVDTLRKMHSALSRSISMAGHSDSAPRNLQGELTAAGAAAPVQQVPGLWVSTWVDYSTKYGLGYLLSDGTVGVYFNDSTKVFMASDGEHFEYVHRSLCPEDGSGARRRTDQPRQAYTLRSYPDELKKKVTLLKYFKSHLLEEQRKKTNVAPEEAASLAAGSPTSSLHFVKKWVRTRHALLFRLSNKNVQVSFMDGTGITLCSEVPVMTYVGKDGRREHHSLPVLMSQHRPDIQKRLKYFKEILHQLISGSRR